MSERDDQLIEDAARAECQRRGLAPDAAAVLTADGRILTNWESNARAIRRDARQYIINRYLGEASHD